MPDFAVSPEKNKWLKDNLRVSMVLKGHDLVEKFGPSETGKGGEGATIVRMASRL